jgi:hypothetical protein
MYSDEGRKTMFLEASEMNVEAALAWASGLGGKLYKGKAAMKFAEMFEEFCFKAEAAKAGWKLAAEPKSAPWALA